MPVVHPAETAGEAIPVERAPLAVRMTMLAAIVLPVRWLAGLRFSGFRLRGLLLFAILLPLNQLLQSLIGRRFIRARLGVRGWGVFLGRLIRRSVVRRGLLLLWLTTL